MSYLEVPVLIVAFKRLETLKLVLDVVLEEHKGPVYVFQDAPRADKDDYSACRAVTDYLSSIENLYGNVEVFVSNENVGCARAIPNAIDWVFSIGYEKIIVLEDDCLPARTFFRFCEEMLERYGDDHRVGMISGNNFIPEKISRKYLYSYYFSHYVHNWGWATWKRAWSKYDHSMSLMKSDLFKENFRVLFPSSDEFNFYRKLWSSQLHNVNDDSWDSRWMLAFLVNRMLCICPISNQVRNIGFGADSTHTSKSSSYHLVPRKDIVFPLSHPGAVVEWRLGDKWWFDHLISKRFLPRVRRYLSRVDPSTVSI